MQTFQLGPVQRFAGANTKIKKPTEIAYFSYDNNHVLLPFSDVSLRYYYPPIFSTGYEDNDKFPIDLSRGYDTFRKRSDAPDEHLDGLLDTLIEAEKREGRKTEIDLITWRGMMTKASSSSRTTFRGTIFVEENHAHKVASNAERQVRWSRPGGPPQDMAMYWGYKFETLSLLEKPWCEVSRDEIEAREDEVVDNYAQYCSICKTGIGSTTMIIGGEVDVLGYKPDNPDEPARWIELKTSKLPAHDRDMQILDKKLLKFWAQSFLLGVPRIVIGYRSKAGHLLRLEELETQKIPSKVRQVGRFKWDGNICINFTGAFLEFLKQTIVGDGVWRIRRAANNPDIEVFRVQETGTGEILKQSFIDWRTQLLAGDIAARLAANGQ
ncbi:hypothetical protein MBLNU459_g5448t1 [Dothideomycetes sp. NU459]